jgi:hypothetical protein
MARKRGHSQGDESSARPRVRLGPPVRRDQGRHDDANAFLPDPDEGAMVASDDDLAEMFGEEFVRAATNGGNVDDEIVDKVLPEELGGPFVETSAREEMADDTDESNPEDATPEPLPRAVSGLIGNPRE